MMKHLQSMRKYPAFFRLHFNMGLQYRTAALAGVATQFFWGLMELLTFHAFYESGAAAFPMTLQNLCTYVWLQQAFLALFMVWYVDHDIVMAITQGNIAYELCRPINLYDMWFHKTLAKRMSATLLRCIPVLILALCIPAPYGLSLPENPAMFLLFLLTLFLGGLVTVAFTLAVYMFGFFTISMDGIRFLTMSMVEFLQGAIIPLPFFPTAVRRVLELLPFAAMQNVPLRVYSGDLSGSAALQAVLLQLFWLVVLVGLGRLLNRHAMRKVIVQGG